ncbi:hypothetical protein ACFQ0G_53080 [Streptomyces chiangmaiensis]
MAGLAPITRSRHLPTDIAPAQTGTLDVQAAPRNFEEWRAYQWAAARTTGSTRLTHVTRYQRDLPDFHGIVVAEFGEAVPDLNPTQLAAVFDCPVGAVWLEDVPNSGPGRKHLIAAPTWYARQTLTDSDPMRRLWEAKISHPKGAAPGMLLTDYRVDENRIALRVTAPDGELIQLNQKRLARAFEVADATLLMVETDGLGEGLISIYKTHPLMNVREATIEDLTMQPDGTIALGQQPDGRIGRVPLYDPQMGAITDLYVGAPGAGKSVTLLHVIAAERLSGIVSIVADAQDGMSLPEVDGRVYHFGKGIAATAATLAAANDLGKYREKISAENSWGSFEIGNPWPLVNVTLDELNRILSADAVVPAPSASGSPAWSETPSPPAASSASASASPPSPSTSPTSATRTASAPTPRTAPSGSAAPTPPPPSTWPATVSSRPASNSFPSRATSAPAAEAPSTPRSKGKKPRTAPSPQAWPTSSTAAACTRTAPGSPARKTRPTRTSST